MLIHIVDLVDEEGEDRPQEAVGLVVGEDGAHPLHHAHPHAVAARVLRQILPTHPPTHSQAHGWQCANNRVCLWTEFSIMPVCERISNDSFSVLRIRIDFNADLDPAFHLNAGPDPDPGSQNNADPCLFGSWSDFAFTNWKSWILTRKNYTSALCR